MDVLKINDDDDDDDDELTFKIKVKLTIVWSSSFLVVYMI